MVWEVRRVKKTLCFLVLILLLFGSSFDVQARSECKNCKEFRQAGFPESYCTGLCALSVLHPNWSFEPLLVTELSRKAGENYDFSYVLEQECKEKERSLVSAQTSYLAYRHEEVFRSDTGAYRASRAAVAYFLDPRNHLSEESIFQFLLLSDSNQSDAGSIARALSGSALEGTVDPQFLLSLGKGAGVDPLFLAVRLFQEQGKEGSVLLTGTAGERLFAWYSGDVQREGGKLILSPQSGFDKQTLLSLDGYFNPFHVSASGSGAFWVYYNGARHAQKMGWDTLEKGLAGGVEKLAGEYIKRNQNTLYLQKWNVDVRSLADNGQSRNFWAQYMQNIGAAKTEGDRLGRLYRQMGLMALPLTFQIPVYEGLPTSLCPDPGQGQTALFASFPILDSEHCYESEEVLAWQEVSAQETVGEPPEREERAHALSFLFVAIFFVAGLVLSSLSVFTLRFFARRLLSGNSIPKNK